MTKVSLAVAALLVLTALLAVPPAAAVVTSSALANPSPALPNQAVTLTYTKTSDNAGDGAQQGSVTPSWSGPFSGSLASSSYNFAGGASETETWTFRAPLPGTYSFTFNDNPTSGPDRDAAASLTVSAAYTTDFTAILSPSVGYSAINTQPTSLDFTVDALGHGVITYAQERPSGAGTDGVTRAFTEAGSQAFASSVACSTGFNCYWDDVTADFSGRLLYHFFTETTAGVTQSGHFQLVNPATGNTHATADSFNAPYSVNGRIMDCDSVAVGASGVTYWCSGDTAQKTIKFDQDLVFNAALTHGSNPTHIVVEDGSTSAGIHTANTCGSGQLCLFTFNPSTMAAVAASINAQCLTGARDLDGGQLKLGTTANTAYMACSGSGSTAIAWNTCLLLAGSCAALSTPTGSQAGRGSTLLTTQISGFDVDGANNLLVCGLYTDGTPRAYAARINTGTNAVTWLQEFPLSGSGLSGNSRICEIDNEGAGFWMVGTEAQAGGTVLRVSHHALTTGTDLTAPASKTTNTVALPALPEDEGGGPEIPGAGSDLAEGVAGFCAALMGDSDASLFFCGLIFVVVVFLALAAAFAALAGSKGLPAALAGSIAGFGIMLFNVFAGIWQAWAGIVLIMVTGGIIAWMVRKMTLSFSGGGAGGGESS